MYDYCHFFGARNLSGTLEYKKIYFLGTDVLQTGYFGFVKLKLYLENNYCKKAKNSRISHVDFGTVIIREFFFFNLSGQTYVSSNTILTLPRPIPMLTPPKIIGRDFRALENILFCSANVLLG